MKQKLTINSRLLIYGIPFFILISSVLLAFNLNIFSGQESIMATAIMIDMVILAPALYFILIYRTHISKFTVTPFFVGSLILASYAIPQAHHGLIDFILRWILPFIELSILGITIYSVIRLRNALKTQKVEGADFLTMIRKSTLSVFPPKLAHALAMEISLFYFTFFTWKKPIYQVNEFTYHKDSGITAIIGVLLGVSLIELFSVHLLLQNSYPVLSWVLFGISLYGIIQLIGLIKSIPRTPIRIIDNKLIVRMGIFSETTFPLAAISAVELTMADYPKKNKSFRKMAFLDHNCIIHLNEEQTIIGLLGIEKKFKHLVISVDNKKEFKSTVEGNHEI